jgi:hypothetical protein
MSGYEELARQLRESVRELGAVPPRRPRRRHGLLVVLAALVVGGGVATAAQTGVLVAKHDDDGAPRSAAQVAVQVVRETSADHACRPLGDGEGAKTQAIAAAPPAAPLLATAADPAATRAVLRYNHGGPVVVDSARHIAFPDGAVVLLWVAVGNGAWTLADPAGCAAARVARLAHDLPDPGSRLRQKAETLLHGYRDTIPGLQTLWIMRRRGPEGGGGGTGIPLDVRSLPVGVVAYGGGRYTGIAAPEAVRVTVDGRGVHRSFAVKARIFALTVPRHTGPLKVRQRAADGRVVAAETLRR